MEPPKSSWRAPGPNRPPTHGLPGTLLPGDFWTSWDLWIEEIGVGNQDVLKTHEQKQVVPAGMNAFMILLSLLVKPCPIFLKACFSELIPLSSHWSKLFPRGLGTLLWFQFIRLLTYQRM